MNDPFYTPGLPITTPVYQQQMANQNRSNDILVVPVQSKEAVTNYLVGAGNTALLMDYPNKKFWLKSTGQDGLSQSLVEHNFEVVSNEKDGKYVSKEEFESVKSQLNKILSKLGDLLDE